MYIVLFMCLIHFNRGEEEEEENEEEKGEGGRG